MKKKLTLLLIITIVIVTIVTVAMTAFYVYAMNDTKEDSSVETKTPLEWAKDEIMAAEGYSKDDMVYWAIIPLDSEADLSENEAVYIVIYFNDANDFEISYYGCHIETENKFDENFQVSKDEINLDIDNITKKIIEN